MSLIVLLALLLFALLLTLGLGVLFMGLVIRRPGLVASIAGFLAVVVVGLGLVLGVKYTRMSQDFGGDPQLARLSSVAPAVTLAGETSPGNVESAPDVTPAHRPAWVDRPSKRREDGAYEISVKSGLYVTPAECQRGLELAEREAVDDYLESYLGAGASRLISLDAAFLRDYLQKAEYHETTTTSVGKMQQLHARLEIDDEARRIFRERWRQALVARNLKYVGAGAALTLALIAGAYGYLSRENRRARTERSLATA